PVGRNDEAETVLREVEMAMKTELATVAARDLQIIEYRGQRVVTTEQLAAGYGTDAENIRRNFNRNKSRFIEGKHYFQITGPELENLRVTFSPAQISNKTRITGTYSNAEFQSRVSNWLTDFFRIWSE
ncbi:TPA: ORF6N domain-containing protein, partial [Salmonella enterica]|nr:ORF6N domain-containing protein [Salmonella enterica]